MQKDLLCNQGVRGFGLIHTQEIRGSSPCAPTILINNLRSFADNKVIGWVDLLRGSQEINLFLQPIEAAHACLPGR